MIRGCYARKEGTERELEERQKESAKALRGKKKKKLIMSEDEVNRDPSSGMSSLSLASPTKRVRSAKKNA